MPIRPEMKERYPANWPEIRANILARAEGKCEWCNVPNGAVGFWAQHGILDEAAFIRVDPASLESAGYSVNAQVRPTGGDFGSFADARLKVSRIVLTIAHIHDHDPANVADDNLAALCQRCHNRHDVAHRRAGIQQRRSKHDLLSLIPAP